MWKKYYVEIALDGEKKLTHTADEFALKKTELIKYARGKLLDKGYTVKPKGGDIFNARGEKIGFMKVDEIIIGQ